MSTAKEHSSFIISENNITTERGIDLPQELSAIAPGQLRVIRRNNKIAPYDDNKIAIAMTKAFLAQEGSNAPASNSIHEKVKQLTEQITATFKRRMPNGGTIHIEDIQDQVELLLMRAGEQKIARAYVLYREEHRKARDSKKTTAQTEKDVLHITLGDGSRVPLDMDSLSFTVNEACAGLEDVTADKIINDVQRNLYDGVTSKDVNGALILSARTLIEIEPNYSFVTSRLLLNDLRNEAFDFLALERCNTPADMTTTYPSYFKHYIKKGIELNRLDPVFTRI